MDAGIAARRRGMTSISLKRSELRELFTETATRRGLSAVVVEKDYWVCVALTAIFDQQQPVDLIFKGGTSLSKCYGVIGRFSEDVDLAFDREGLGFTADRDPEAPGLGSNRRKALIEELTAAAATYIGGAFREHTAARLIALIGDKRWTLEGDPNDPQTLLFAYPQSLDRGAYGSAGYIRPAVRLELGARSDQTPSSLCSVTAFITEEFGTEVSHLNPIKVPTLTAERTFWEKATLLHAECQRERPFEPARSRSRHLYDLVQLITSEHGAKALADTALRDRVVQHKSLYFASASARYDLFKPLSIRLLPKDADALSRLRADYADMAVMFFDSPPKFDTLVEEIQGLENALNKS